ncbi:MAG: hypothetical protein ACOCYQ_05600, partial [Alkalispirochaeta sp.]
EPEPEVEPEPEAEPEPEPEPQPAPTTEPAPPPAAPPQQEQQAPPAPESVKPPEALPPEPPSEPEEEVPPPDPSLRRKLQNMIEKVRKQLGPPPEPKPGDEDEGPFAKHARMFKYLMSLAGSLPPDRDREYRQSEERLKLAGVTARLSGHETLRHKLLAARKRAETAAREGGTPLPRKPGDVTVDRRKLAGTFSYLSGLSSTLPDGEIAEQLSTRARRISERIERDD